MQGKMMQLSVKIQKSYNKFGIDSKNLDICTIKFFYYDRSNIEKED